MKNEIPCPCLFCRIERERDFSCREMSCQTYVDWKRRVEYEKIRVNN